MEGVKSQVQSSLENFLIPSSNPKIQQEDQ